MVKKYFTSIFFILSLFIRPVIYAQVLPFQNYSIKNGLISINIHSICEDSLGFIWIGTEEGISVFNSREFVNYTTLNGLSSNNISCLAADGKVKGKVWIASYGSGVDVYENGRFRNIDPGLPAKFKGVNILFPDEHNIVWCGNDYGLFVIKNDSIKILHNTEVMGSVSAIVQTGGNTLWIGSDKGLYTYNKRTRKIRQVISELPHQTGFSCLLSFNNFIWAATWSGRVYKISRNKKIITVLHMRQKPFSMCADAFGNIWIGTGKGLFKINPGQTGQIKIKRVLMGGISDENIISALLSDKENILWCGSNADGLYKLVYQNFFKIHIPVSKTLDYWSSTVVDKNNHFWAALDSKLFELWSDKNKIWHLKLHNITGPQLQLPIQKIFVNEGNNLFTAFMNGIVKVYSIRNKNPDEDHSVLKLRRIINLKNTAKYYGLFTIRVDRNGMMWCSLLDAGVAVWDIKKNKLVKFYNDKSGMPDNSVRAIFEDSSGNYWFGGYDHGLTEFSKDKILKDLYHKDKGNIFIKYYSTKNGLPGNDIRSLKENAEHEIVAATRYNGIAFIKDNKIATYDRNNGLISNGIWDLTIDSAKNIWFGSQSGIQEINYKDKIINFPLIEDIPRVPYYSICASREGSICFANNTDIYIYCPRPYVPDREALPIYVNHILVNGREAKIRNSFSLPSFNNTITFDFICVTNREGKNIHYLYRLLGSSKNWTPIKGKPSVTFASLSPGNYSFQVMAEDNRSYQSTHPAEINFIIDAPFYLHWWFIALIISAVLASIFIASKSKFNRLLEIEKIRTRIAADLHDEIGSGLTRIAILSEHAMQEEKNREEPENKYDKYSKHVSMERVGKISRNLVDSMIDVIWSIDPKYDSLTDFIFNFKTYANEVCEAKNIRLHIKTDNIQNVKVNSQIKRSLQLISKEALNNALKYSGCTEVIYSLSVENKHINLSLEDNGGGFESKEVKLGHGLANMAKHAQELSGKFNLNAVPGKGTKISVVFPIRT